MHISCHLDSSKLQMADCVSGSLKVEQCNMAIQSISVGIVQNESMRMGLLVFLMGSDSEREARVA